MEEVVTEDVAVAFGASAIKFHAAGREDIDVRMLGRGRPFILEVQDATRLPLGREAMGQLQARVNAREGMNGEGDVEVEALQHVPKSLFMEILAGQVEKQKTYGCVVWVSRAVSEEELTAKLDGVRDLAVAQDTPVRVVHRRAPLVRMKTIVGMR